MLKDVVMKSPFHIILIPELGLPLPLQSSLTVIMSCRMGTVPWFFCLFSTCLWQQTLFFLMHITL